MDTTHKTSQIAIAAAALSVAAWTAKAVAIGLAGGLDLSPAEGPFFFLGLLASLVALSCLVLVWARPQGLAGRTLAVLGGVLLGVGLAAATRLAVAVLEPSSPSWVWAEVNLWFVAAVVLSAAVITARKTVTHQVRPAVAATTQ